MLLSYLYPFRMQNENNVNRLIEISTRAASINQRLIEEENHLKEELLNPEKAENLQKIRDTIRQLLRKEILYSGAALKRLQIIE